MGSSYSQQDKTVLIIGGGVAGVAAAKVLDGLCNVVMIEKKNKQVNAFSIHRDIVQGTDQSIIPQDNLIQKHGLIIQGELKSINSELKIAMVNHQDGSTSEINYDYLIVAIGSSLNTFKDNNSTDIIASIDQMYNKMSHSSNIAVVGAGAVGIELIGELRDKQPEIKLTLVGQSLLANPSGLPESIKDTIKAQMKEQNIEQIAENTTNELNLTNWTDRVTFDVDLHFKNHSSTHQDVVINCAGQKPLNSFTIDGEQSSGQQTVNNQLQSSFQDVFFIGDCNTGLGLNKQGIIAGDQGKWVGNQIIAKINNAHYKEFINESGDRGAKIMMPFTKQGGFGQMGGFNLPLCMVQGMKNKDLFVGMVKGNLNVNDTASIDTSKIDQWQSKLKLNNLHDKVLSVQSHI